MSTICFLCQTETSPENVCPDCERVHFCSQSHLNVHRGTLKYCQTKGKKNIKVCWPFRIGHKEGVGRVMIATRDIEATETILEEDPATWGPNNKTKPVCLNCLKDAQQRCKNCGFVVCDQKCENGEMHRVECGILQKLDEPVNFDFEGDCQEYMCVMPLRMLELKKSNSDLWQRVQLLMDHNQQMKSDEALMWKTNVVELLQKRCGYLEHSEEDLFRAIGIVNTNGVNQGVIKGHGLYPTFSFLSHSCVNNSRFHVYHDRRLVLRAQCPIAEGEEVLTRYLPSMIGSLRRRQKIRRNWHFDCTCRRCADKTEFGTMLNAVVCHTCKQGYMLPQQPLDYDSLWQCDKCPASINSITMTALVNELEAESDSFKELEIGKVEERIEKWCLALHPRHHIILNFKRRLMDLYRLIDAPEGKERLWLERQVALGSEILGVIQRIEEGYSLHKGRVLRQLHKPSLTLAKMDLKDGKLSMAQFVGTTKTIIHNMKDALKCLEDFDLYFVASANLNTLPQGIGDQ